MGSLALEGDYAYTAKDGSCQDSSIAGVASAEGVTNVRPFFASALLAAIELGPVSVTVEADTRAFQGYTGGVLNSSACGTQLDHAITAVGWGTESGQDYYLVRNSWGASWGDAGYIKIAAKKVGFGICGIQI